MPVYMVMHVKLRSTLRRMLSMCPDAWYIFIRSVQLCCLLLFCAFMLLLEWDGSMTNGYDLYMTAMGLMETGQGLLLIAGILSVCIEDLQR